MTSEGSKICALCKIFSSGNLLYVQESETLICNDRHLCNDAYNLKDDDIHLNSYRLDARSRATQNRRSRSELTLTSKDKPKKQAHFGGDGDKNIIDLKETASINNLKNEIELKNVQNDIDISSPKLNANTAIAKRDFVRNSQEDDNLETTLMYQNKNFRESSTSLSTSTIIQDIANDKFLFFEQTSESVEAEADIIQRQLKCPIGECSKILNKNSIFSHFHFDHSKIPMIHLNKSIKLTVKIDKFISQNNCLAVLLPSVTKNQCFYDGVETTVNHKKSYPLFLMGVRLMYPFHNVKPEPVKRKNQIFYKEARTNREKHESEKNYETHPSVSNYALLLWLCSIDNDEAVYAITVTSEGSKFFRNCIGPAFNLRDRETSAFHLAESLVIQGATVNLFCGKQDQIVILVQSLDF